MKKELLAVALAGIFVCASLTACTAEWGEGTTGGVIGGFGHTHTFATEWSKDDSYHWHEASCGDGAVSEKAEHTLRNNVCTVCGYFTTIDETTNVSKIPTEIVTAEEWDAAFSGQTFENLTMFTSGSSVEGISLTTSISKDGFLSIMMEGGKPSAGSTIYLNKPFVDDGVEYDSMIEYYVYISDERRWLRYGTSLEEYNQRRERWLEGMTSFKGKFSEATYHAEGGYYALTIVEESEYRTTTIPYRLKFMDGKLFALGTITTTSNGQDYGAYGTLYHYGTTVVEAPKEFSEFGRG